MGKKNRNDRGRDPVPSVRATPHTTTTQPIPSSVCPANPTARTSALAAAVAAFFGIPAADVKKGAAAANTTRGNVDGGEGVVGTVVQRWQRQDLLEKSGSVLCVTAWAFSLLGFVVMGTNDHGDWMQFEHYEEYR
ncbi:hypothetical protein E2562_005505 [Oryza meyeriana var. granulata]|uniref:CASP-like protein n=1 Tax=Oryza meyeriana var. granulata TaxID=110450 RepID=A0A6G1F3X4_9ORYZ|nr:hypothetical protein E2562_005505 [Oryza meyeriana var. granulata]